MAAITNYSNTYTFEPLNSPLQTEEVKYKTSTYYNDYLGQHILIISTIALAIILSASGVLPAAILIGAKVAAIEISIMIALALIVYLLDLCNKEIKDDDLEDIPVRTIIIGPLVEEIICRLGLQGGLQFILENVMQETLVTILGFQFSVAGLVSILIAGSIFGLLHANNDHENSHIQALFTGLVGVCMFGPLYYYYGLTATITAHMVYNAIGNTLLLCPTTEKEITNSGRIP